MTAAAYQLVMIPNPWPTILVPFVAGLWLITSLADVTLDIRWLIRRNRKDRP